MLLLLSLFNVEIDVVIVVVDVAVVVAVDVGKKLQHGLRLFRLFGSERKAHNVRPRPLRNSDCRQTPEQTRRATDSSKEGGAE